MSTNRSVMREKVADVQKKAALQSWFVRSIRLLAFAAVLAAVIALLDYFWVFPTWLRALAGAGALVALIARVFQRTQAYALSDAAAAVEAKHPEYGQRIRTTLDYSDPGTPTADANPSFIQALARETEQRSKSHDFSSAVDRRPLRYALCSTIGLFAVLLVTAICVPELWISAARVLLLPLHYTELNVAAIDAPIATGEDATITAAIDGRPVDSAMLHYKLDSQDQWQTMPLELTSHRDDEDRRENEDENRPVKIAGEVAATLTDCQESFAYRVTAGPRESQVYRVTVLAPLELQSLKVQVKPPPYTRLADEETDSLDLKVIEGTNIDFLLMLNRAPANASLVPVDANDDEATSLAINGSTVHGQFQELSEAQHFVIRAQAPDGIRYETERFRIHVRPDGKPKIRFVKPPEDLEVIPTAEVPLTVDASDDFGIRRVGIAARVADGPLETLWEEEFPQDGPARNEARARPVLFLEEHELNFQDAVTYYAYVIDNRPGEGRRTSTELRFIDIRPFKREYQMLQGGGT